MRLELELTRDDLARLRRMARKADSGFTDIAAVIVANARARPDASARATLTTFSHISRFWAKRDSGDGGFQSAFRKLGAVLVLDDGRELREPGEIRLAIYAEERRRTGTQLSMTMEFWNATTTAA